jgi:hypothetical protein
MADDQADLLQSMHVLAARYATVDPELRGWRRILAAERECAFTPSLLAARSSGELSDGEREQFDRHLESCLTCQAAELRFGRAERSFNVIAHAPAAVEPEPQRDAWQTPRRER